MYTAKLSGAIQKVISLVVLLAMLIPVGSVSGETEVLFEDDFEDGNTDGWTLVEGDWEVLDGRYRGKTTTGFNTSSITVAGDTTWTDYTYEGQFKLDQGIDRQEASILFRLTEIGLGLNQGRYYQITNYPDNSENESWVGLNLIDNGTITALGTVAYHASLYQWRSFKLAVNETHLAYYIDNELVMSSDALTAYSGGKIGLKSAHYDVPIYFDDLRVTRELPDAPQIGPVFTVNSTAGADDGMCGVAHCTVREAINAANADGSESTIELGSAATYTLDVVDHDCCGFGGTGLPRITTAITINGHGSTIARSSASGTPDFRLFSIWDGTLILNDAVITGGRADAGGGILLYSGDLIVNNSTISGNYAIGGGGIWSNTQATLTDSVVANNTSLLDGGGIGSNGTLVISHSNFADNIAGQDGGAIVNHGTVEIDNTPFTGNVAESGGAIANRDTGNMVNVSRSIFSQNRGSLGGGAIANRGGATNTVNVTDTAFIDNQADGGGGLSNSAGVVTVTNSTFANNNGGGQGGGLWNSGVLHVVNNTIYNNNADIGGGILNMMGGAVDITNSTLSDNRVIYDGGGIYNYENSTVTLKNTIISNSPAGNNCAGAMVTDGGGNLVWGDTTCPGTNADPLLGPMADNGGTTQTMALLRGSPAIEAGNAANCPATDQRGVARPQAARCDIGAFELEMLTNAPPVAEAGGPYDAKTEDEITMDASVSFDPDGDTLTYEWDLDNDGGYDDATGVTATTVFNEAGEYTIRLRVTDIFGLTDVDTATVTVSENIPSPGFGVRANDDEIEGWWWPQGAVVNVTIEDLATPESPDYSGTAVVDIVFPGNDHRFRLRLNGEFDIVPGHIVTVSDGNTTRHTTVTGLAVTNVNADTDVVSGVAATGSFVHLWVCTPTECANRHVFADSNGNWSGNFSVPGAGTDPGEQVLYDIVPGTRGDAAQWDMTIDGGGTSYFWHVLSPNVSVHPDDDWLEGYDWPAGVTVNISIDDPATQTNPDLSRNVVTGTSSWNSSENYFNLDLQSLYDIKPGFVVRVTYGTTTKEHVVTNLIVTSVDAAADKVSGTADPNVNLQVDVWSTNGTQINIQTDSNGNWIADLAGQYDLQTGDDGRVQEFDGDGDSTGDDWRIPNPLFMLNIHNDSSWQGLDAWNWPLGSQVTLTVDDPNAAENENPVYTEVQTMVQGTGSHETQAWFMPDNIEFTGQPGFTITLSDGVQEKSMVVPLLQGTEYNLEADTVSGVTDPSASVVVACGLGAEPSVTADSNGNWMANFRDPQNPNIVLYDIQPGTWCEPQMYDEDRDHIVLRDWFVPYPSEDLLISDAGGKLWQLDPQTFTVSEFQQLDVSGNFDFIRGSSSEIYIANYSHARVDRLNLETQQLVTIAGGSPLINPIGLALSPDGGTLYVADPGAHSVFSLDLQTRQIDILADHGPDSESFSPDGITMDSNGNVVFDTSNGSIYRVSPDGGSITRIVNIPNANLNGMAFLNAEELLIAGTENPQGLLQVNVSTGEVTTLYEGLPFRNPEDVVVDLQNNYAYVLDSDYMHHYSDFRPGIYAFDLDAQTLQPIYVGSPFGDIVDLLLGPFPQQTQTPQCQPGDTVTGTVFEHDGVTPVPSAYIQIDDYNTGEIRFTSHADQNGQFGCSLPDGDYRILAGTDGYTYTQEYYNEAAEANVTPLHVITSSQFANINFTISPTPAIEHLTFNLDNVLLQDPAIRHAIALGTDRQRILNEAFLPNGIYGMLSNSIVVPEHWASAPSLALDLYPFDPAEARTILETAGWIDNDSDGFRENDRNEELAFVFKTRDTPFRMASGEIFRQNMADIGVRIDPIYSSTSDFISNKDFDIAEFAWAGCTDNEPCLSEYVTGSSWNLASYSNTLYDAAIASARTAIGDAVKLPYLIQAQAILTQDLPVLPLFTRYDITPAATASGSDITVSPVSNLTIRFENVTQSGVTGAAVSPILPASPPANFELLGMTYHIGTTALFTGNAHVCITYDPSSLTTLQELGLRLYHLENDTWANVTDTGSPDTALNQICGTVASFSPFAVMQQSDQTPPVIPANFYGEIHILENPPVAGNMVEVYVPGLSVPVATTAIAFYPPDLLVYTIDVPGDAPDTQVKEGGAEGDLLTFKVNGRVAATGIWHSGTSIQLDFHPPEVVSGGPYGADEGSPIIFSASRNDFAADAATYYWDWDNNGTYYEDVSDPTHMWPDNGDYTVGLKVVDTQGGEDSTTFNVTINDALPASVSAGGPYNGIAGQPVTLNGSATCSSTDNCIFAWDLDGDTAYDDATGAAATFTWNMVGDHPIGLSVTDDDGNSATGTSLIHMTTATHGIALVPGWNLVSFNVHPLDNSISSVLSSIAGQYTLVYAWDTSAAHSSSGNWMKYDPAAPAFSNTLESLNEGMGFWIRMRTADTLEVQGSIPSSTDINLTNAAGGWNLVGYPSAVNRILPGALGDNGVDIYFSLTYAYHASDSADPWKLFGRTSPVWSNDLTALTPGWGYWIKVSATELLWTVPYSGN